MPEDARARFYEFSKYSLILIYLVFWLIPPVNYLFFTIVHLISDLLGVPSELGWYGYDAFRFWTHGD